MIITKRDIESFMKKECVFKEDGIYIDQIQVHCFVREGDLCMYAPKLSGLFMFMAKQKKYIDFKEDVLKISHPLVKIAKIEVHEDDMEITFK